MVMRYRGQQGAISSAGERFVHTEEVTGSIPVSPTIKTAAHRHYWAPWVDLQASQQSPIVSESSADVIIVIERAQDATVIVGAARVEVQRG